MRNAFEDMNARLAGCARSHWQCAKDPIRDSGTHSEKAHCYSPSLRNCRVLHGCLAHCRAASGHPQSGIVRSPRKHKTGICRRQEPRHDSPVLSLRGNIFPAPPATYGQNRRYRLRWCATRLVGQGFSSCRPATIVPGALASVARHWAHRPTQRDRKTMQPRAGMAGGSVIRGAS